MNLTGFSSLHLMLGMAGGLLGAWYFARQLYTAAMHDFIMTGVPETRHYRDQHPALFRNNVIGAIVVLPMLVGGAVVAALELLG